MCKQMCLRDITPHLNQLNLQFQHAGKTVLDLYENRNIFVAELHVSQDIENSIFHYFQHLKKTIDKLYC